MRLRDARPGDAVGLAEVWVEGWRAAYADLMPAAYLDGLEVSKETAGWQRRLTGPDPKRRHTSIAIEGDRVVGFVTIGPDPDDSASGHVLLIYTRPEVWGSGVGTELMNAALRSLRDQGFGEVILWVLEGNTRARAFYERGGWSVQDARRSIDYGGVLLPAVEYRRDLARVNPA